MNKPIRIAFGCQSRVGKDTAARYVVEQFGCKLFSFASPVYDICDCIQSTLNIPNVKHRELLKFIGEGLKDVYRNRALWAEHLEDRIKSERDIVVSDLRFPEELQMLKRHGFKTIMIIRDEYQPEKLFLDESDFDSVIYNNSSLEDFYEKIKNQIISS